MVTCDLGRVMVIRLNPSYADSLLPMGMDVLSWLNTAEPTSGQVKLIFHHQRFESAEMVGVGKSRFCFDTQIRQTLQKDWNSGL